MSDASDLKALRTLGATLLDAAGAVERALILKDQIAGLTKKQASLADEVGTLEHGVVQLRESVAELNAQRIAQAKALQDESNALRERINTERANHEMDMAQRRQGMREELAAHKAQLAADLAAHQAAVEALEARRAVLHKGLDAAIAAASQR